MKFSKVLGAAAAAVAIMSMGMSVSADEMLEFQAEDDDSGYLIVEDSEMDMELANIKDEGSDELLFEPAEDSDVEFVLFDEEQPAEDAAVETQTVEVEVQPEFVVVNEDQAPAETQSAVTPAPQVTVTPAKTGGNPKTGNPAVALAVIPVALMAAGVLAHKKNK